MPLQRTAITPLTSCLTPGVHSSPLFYSIYFLSEPTATAAAAQIRVSDIVDQDLDLSTLSLDGITVGG